LPDASKRIYTLSREVIEFQRAVAPLDGILVSLREQLKERAGASDLELRRALRDVADHATRSWNAPRASDSCWATFSR
jgi:magnesium transporter